jgi:hypothetical protein
LFSFLFARIFNDNGLNTIAILEIKLCGLGSRIEEMEAVFEAFLLFEV